MKKDEKDKTTTCACCNTEIPLSSAVTPEGADYVRHFCGKDCLQKWRDQKKENDKSESS